MALTSQQAFTRVGNEINECYRSVISALGLDIATRVTVTQAATIGNRSVVFSGITKVYDVFLTSGLVRLDQMVWEQLRNQAVAADPPKQYAVQLMGASTVTVFLSTIPASTLGFTADGIGNVTDLSGIDIPQFPADYHNLLIYGPMAVELYKMEKPDIAGAQQKMFDDRLSQLQTFIVK